MSKNQHPHPAEVQPGHIEDGLDVCHCSGPKRHGDVRAHEVSHHKPHAQQPSL